MWGFLLARVNPAAATVSADPRDGQLECEALENLRGFLLLLKRLDQHTGLD